MATPIFITRIKEQFEENPSLVLGASAAFLMGSAKIIDAVSSARSRSAYAKQVKHSTKKSRK
jgi:hypothetical protein